MHIYTHQVTNIHTKNGSCSHKLFLRQELYGVNLSFALITFVKIVIKAGISRILIVTVY